MSQWLVLSGISRASFDLIVTHNSSCFALLFLFFKEKNGIELKTSYLRKLISWVFSSSCPMYSFLWKQMLLVSCEHVAYYNLWLIIAGQKIFEGQLGKFGALKDIYLPRDYYTGWATVANYVNAICSRLWFQNPLEASIRCQFSSYLHFEFTSFMFDVDLIKLNESFIHASENFCVIIIQINVLIGFYLQGIWMHDSYSL